MAESCSSSKAAGSTSSNIKGNDRIIKKDAEGNTPLHIAARKGNKDSIEILLKLGMSLEEPNNKGETALYLAAASGNLEAVQSLLEAGANTNAQTDGGRTVWHVAAADGNSAILSALVEEEMLQKSKMPPSVADVQREKEMRIEDQGEAASNFGRASIESSRVGAISNNTNGELYSKNDKKLDKTLETNKEKKSVMDDTELANEFAKNKNSKTQRIGKSKKDNCKDLERKGSFRSQFPERSYSQGNDYPNQFFTPLNTDNETFIDFDEMPFTAVFLHNLFRLQMRENCEKEKAKFFLDNILRTRDVDMNKRDENGFTALHIAAACGAEDAVFRFLKKKPDVNAESLDGATPLMMAAAGNSIKVIKMLVKAGAKCFVKDRNGRTPLHIAAVNNNPQFIKLFLSYGLNPNDQEDMFGHTPLHILAVKARTCDSAVVLLQNNADMNIIDEDGLTPLDLAVIFQNEEMMRFLIFKRI